MGKTTAKTANKTATRVEPEITKVSAAVEMPTVTANRPGNKSKYPFDELKVGESFGIKNKTKTSMASVISNQNKKNMKDKLDENGVVVMKQTEATGADGEKTMVPTNEPEKVREKFFFAVDCDPKSDPDGASVRVFRKL